jgi:hypothetical protein
MDARVQGAVEMSRLPGFLQRNAAVKRLLLCVIFASVACGHDDPADPSDDFGTFSATVNSVQFTAGAGSSATLSQGSLSISAVQVGVTDNRFFDIELDGVNGPGTFTIGAGEDNLNFASYSESDAQGANIHVWDTDAEGGSGQVVITQVTATRVTGTFSFVAEPSFFFGGTGTKTVTNGSFSMNLTDDQ